MRLSYRLYLQVLLIISIAFASISITQNAHADAPSIKVSPIWHPGTQLSTIDSGSPDQTDAIGDDLRYVDLEINVTTNVQFWAMELTCTVNKAVLESYAQNSDPFATEDNTPIVTWSSSWILPAAQVAQPFNTTTGAMTIAAANPVYDPLGQNTITNSFSLATIRYRVKPMTAASTSTLTCTGSFLNADGKPVLAPVFVMPRRSASFRRTPFPATCPTRDARRKMASAFSVPGQPPTTPPQIPAATLWFQHVSREFIPVPTSAIHRPMPRWPPISMFKGKRKWT